MKKHLTLAAAAALAVAAMGLNVRAADDAANQTTNNNPNALERAADKTGDAARNAADKTGDALKTAADKTKGALSDLGPGKEEIHDVLAQVAEAAMTKEGLDDMVERFVDADRNRIGKDEAAIKNQAELDGLVAQLQQDWKTKYSHEFDIKDEDKVYDGFAMIMQGEIGESARQASDKVNVDANANRNADGTVRTDVKVENNTGVDAPKTNTDGQTAADSNRNDPGRNIAYVALPASHGLPEVKVPLIHEATGWKIDVPDTLDGNKLRDNVKNALTLCKENKDKWPADENEAYRVVSHKILAAIMDKPLQDPAQKASDAQAPAAAPAANPQ
ncbi:MAG: hypothetical protein QOF78_2553 [Phycisphaerales bacterium]|jgi:hypothetical protein|nr:hypothetical protein [Phycisphaerales bacterium]